MANRLSNKGSVETEITAQSYRNQTFSLRKGFRWVFSEFLTNSMTVIFELSGSRMIHCFFLLISDLVSDGVRFSPLDSLHPTVS